MFIGIMITFNTSSTPPFNFFKVKVLASLIGKPWTRRQDIQILIYQILRSNFKGQGLNITLMGNFILKHICAYDHHDQR
jgi:hypothetical protein